MQTFTLTTEAKKIEAISEAPPGPWLFELSFPDVRSEELWLAMARLGRRGGRFQVVIRVPNEGESI